MEFAENSHFGELLGTFAEKQKIKGVFADAVRFIEAEQLLDEALWAKFVHQFREKPDAASLAWRGEFWGKMMRGAASVYAYTHSEKLYTVLEKTVRDMLTVADSDGRVSTYVRENEFSGWDIWCRKYVLLGMLYFYDICKSGSLKSEILGFAIRHADYIMSHIGEGKQDITKTSQAWLGINSSSLLEGVVWLYEKTGEKRFLEFADYLVRRGGADGVNVIELALENKLLPYQYGVSKAYEMTSYFEGVLAYYRVTGIEKYKTAALNYGYALLDSEVSVIGSLGCTHELLDHTAVAQTSKRDRIQQETCVTVTWMKYCASLYRLTGDTRFSDAMETSFYNAYLGALNTEHRESENLPRKFFADGSSKTIVPSFMPFDSYSPLTPDARGNAVGGGQLFSDGSYYGCCASIGALGLGLYATHRLRCSGKRLTLTFFDDGESEITLGGGRVRVTVEGGYPKNGEVRITLDCDRPIDFELALRLPAWSENTVITSSRAHKTESGFAVFCGTWQEKTDIRLAFDMKLRRFDPVPWETDVIYTVPANRPKGFYFVVAQKVFRKSEEDHFVSLARGPIVLAADSRLGKPADSLFPFPKNGAIPTYADGGREDALVSVHFSGAEEFTLIDYASAGKDWQSKIGAWLPIGG